MTMPDDFKFDSRIRQRMLRRGDLTPAELTAHVEALPDLQDEHEVMNEFTQPALAPARADALDPSPAFDPLRRVGIGSSAYSAKVPSPSLAAKPLPRPVTPLAQPAPVRAAPPPAPVRPLDNGLAQGLSPRIESAVAEPAAERAHKAWSGIDLPHESESTPGSTLRSEPSAVPQGAVPQEPAVARPEPVVAKPPSLDDEDEDEDEDDDDDDLDDDDDDLEGEGDDDIEGESDDDDLDEDDDDLDDDDDDDAASDDEEPPTNPRGAQ